MRVFCLAVFFAGWVLRAAAYTSADAADPSYIGTWKITGAVVAPWSTAARAPDTAERARLMGQELVFKSRGIAGPQPFACQGSHYNLVDDTTDLLFQGAFDEMRQQDKSVDPDKIAAGLGFQGNTVRTLETGCEFDFHFVDASTAQVGLNDFVYTLKKQ